MELLDILRTYFRGETLESAFFIAPAGLFLVALGVAAIRAETPTYGWAVAVPCFVCGLLLLGVGVGITVRTPGQVSALVEGLQADPAATVASEVVRMEKVMSNFHMTLPVFGAIAVVGLALRFGLSAEWAQGLGPTLVLLGGLGLLIDGFASRRAGPYVEALAAQARADDGSEGAEVAVP